MHRIPVIFDVDTGLDDSMALFVGVNDPRFDVLAVTATYGNTRLEYALQNSLNAIAMLKRKDIPVAAGAAQGWKMARHTSPHIHGYSGIGTYQYQTDSRENYVPVPAWDLIAQKCLGSEEKVTVFVLGPCTNAANAVRKYPEIISKIDKIIFMGGGFREGASGQCQSVNVFHDPEAFRSLVTCGIPFHMCTSQQFTEHLQVTPKEAKEAFCGRNELCDAVYHMICDYQKASARFDRNIPDDETPVILHDPACILYALDPDTAYTKKVFCDIELQGTWTYGMTVIDINDRYHKTDAEKNVHLVYAREGIDPVLKDMFINGIRNAWDDRR